MWSPKQIALTQVAINELSGKTGYFDKLDLLEILSKITGYEVTTRKDKRLHDGHFKLLVRELTRLGFKPIDKQHAEPENRSGWATFKQLDYMCRLWIQITKHPEHADETLESFILNRFGVHDRNWIKKQTASGIIEAMKNMLEQKVKK